MKEKDMEAVQWLKNNKNKYAFASNYFSGTENALKFVKSLYRRGVSYVEIDGIYSESWRIKAEGGPYADTLVIFLPEDSKKIPRLKKFIRSHRPDEISGTWDSRRQIILWWD